MVPPLGHRLLSSCTPLISAFCHPVHWVVRNDIRTSARTRLSADGKSAAKGGQRQYTGIMDVYRQTLRTDGIPGLYRGFVPNILGIIVYRGL